LDTNDEILQLRIENAALKEENAALKVQLFALIEKTCFLEKRIETLLVKKDSHNSSIPPSKEIIKRNQSLRPKSDKKRGGQNGHKGHSLKMTDQPNEIIKLEPSFCNQCGQDLSLSPSDIHSRRQVIEIPPIKPIYVEYQAMSKSCSCGHLQVADYPEHVSNHIQYGSSVQSIITYESVRQFTPFARLSEKMLNLFQLPISPGTIRNILHNMAQKALPIYENIQKRIEKSEIVGGDETGINVAGKNWWAWVFQNSLITFIFILPTRGIKAVTDYFKNGFSKAILVSDRWRAHLNTFAKGHQLCFAHLLRDLNYLIELEKTKWATDTRELFLKAIELKKQLPDFNNSNPQVKQIEQQMDRLLEHELEKETTPKTLVFQKALKNNRNYLFPFLYYQNVPPDNNGSERAVRNIKVKQKISGQFNGGQHDFAILRSVIDTSIKNSRDVFQTLQEIANFKKKSNLAVAE